MARISLIQSLPGHSDRAWSLDWSPAEPILASCSTDKSVRLYSFQPPTPSSSSSSSKNPFVLSSTIPTSHTRTVRNLAFSPAGSTLATASFDSTVGIWCKTESSTLLDDDDDDGGDPQAGREGGRGSNWEAVDPLEGHESECKSVAWSRDARLLASCSRDKSVWVWEAVGPAEFECLAVLMEHSQDVKCVAWHPTEELLASSSYDDSIHLYAPDPHDDEFQLVERLEGHKGTVWSVSFSPCGRYLASTGDDLTLKVWERKSIVDDERDALGRRDDGTTTATTVASRVEGGTRGGGIRIGQKEKFRWTLVVDLERVHERSVYSVDWKEGGEEEVGGAGLGRIVTGSGDGKIRVWQAVRTPRADLARDSTASDPSRRPPRDDRPSISLVPLATVQDAHGVSDVNSVRWCTLNPRRASRTLRALEGGESEEEERGGGGERGEGGEEEEDRDSTALDSRWKACQDWFASAGDDGVVKVWRIESTGPGEGEGGEGRDPGSTRDGRIESSVEVSSTSTSTLTAQTDVEMENV
ncbi:hypothetical protein JCM10212_004571 [Sporobolomyces blumeae]